MDDLLNSSDCSLKLLYSKSITLVKYTFILLSTISKKSFSGIVYRRFNESTLNKDESSIELIWALFMFPSFLAIFTKSLSKKFLLSIFWRISLL